MLTLGHGAICGGLGLSRRQGVADIKRELEVALVEEDAEARVYGHGEHTVGLAGRDQFLRLGKFLLFLRSQALEDVGRRLLASVKSLIEPFLGARLPDGRRAGLLLLGC